MLYCIVEMIQKPKLPNCMNFTDLDTHEMVRFNQENSWPAQKRFINLMKKYLIEHLQGKLGEKGHLPIKYFILFCLFCRLHIYQR